MKKTLLITTAALLLNACDYENPREQKREVASKQETTLKLRDIAWLQGNWEMRTPEGILKESWESASDSELHGNGILINEKGDTLFSEKLRIVLRDSLLWYMPTVSDQNNAQEIGFKEKSISGYVWTFENTTHDFPQRIIYSKQSDTAMNARIEGVKNGVSKHEDFYFTRTTTN